MIYPMQVCKPAGSLLPSAICAGSIHHLVLVASRYIPTSHILNSHSNLKQVSFHVLNCIVDLI